MEKQLTNFTKNSAIYVLGSILNKSAGIILIPLYTRYFTLEEYGTLSILLLILQLGSFISLLGISSAAMRFYFDYTNEIDRKRLYGTALFMAIILPVIVCAFGFVILYYGHDIFFSSIPFFPHLQIILFLSALAPLIKLYIGLLRVREAAVSYIIFNFLFVLSQFVFIIVAVKYLALGLRGQLQALLASYILFWLISLLLFLKEVRISFSLRLTKKILAFGLPLVPSFFLIWGLSSAGRFALERFESLAEVGLFSLAAQFSGILGLIAVSVDNALLPYYYQTAGAEDPATQLGEFVGKFITVFGIIALTILSFSTHAVQSLASENFFPAIDYIPFLVLVSWIGVTYKIFYWNLMFYKRTKLILSILGLSTFVLILLLYLFVALLQLGIGGVILSMTIANIILLTMAYSFSQNLLEIKFPYKKIFVNISLLLFGGFLIVLVDYSVKILIYSIGFKILLLVFVSTLTIKCIGVHPSEIFEFRNILRYAINK